MRTTALFILLASAAWPQVSQSISLPDSTSDPAYGLLTKAFGLLRVHDYDAAIAAFQNASAVSPQRSDIHKNLAYTFLKTGDSESARNEFGIAVRIEPGDFHVALEYAFLCFEAKDDAPARKAEARRIFASIRNNEKSDETSRTTAATAFHNIDDPLKAEIERWKQVVATSEPAFSAYYELAHLAEERDELEMAAMNYQAAFRLLPGRKSVLLELARAEKARGNAEGNIAALLAASRGPEPRTAELAREQLPARYPYVYEFRQALDLDPTNEALRRELAYLLLQMSESGQASRKDAEEEFALLVTGYGETNSAENSVVIAQLGLLYLADQNTDIAMPLLNRALAHGDDRVLKSVRSALHMPPVLVERGAPNGTQDQTSPDPRAMGDRSYQAGFLKDALRYFTQAQEANPRDSSLALKLGWTNNMLHDDPAALRWFDIARKSDDPAIAAEAKRAWSNLRSGQRRFRTTVWLYPLSSSRWGDLFGYGQVKTELRLKSVPLHPYASIRLAGDVRRTTSGPLPQSLSESAFITALGVATDTWRGAMAWFEAGGAVSYLNGTHWSDYRGGIAYDRTYGTALAGERSGWFFEPSVDSVYISHFNRNLITYIQSRVGYTKSFGSFRTQFFWSQNLTLEAKRQYWANFFEAGVGFRIHPPHFPTSLWFNVGAVRGIYLRNEGNPGRPNFYDFRVGVWYAFTK